MKIMTLFDAAKLYTVYLKGLHLPAEDRKSYQSVLQDILEFYGKFTPLDAFDESVALDYVSINDPFDCDPIHEQRGDIYCQFIDWLIHNQLIPAWAQQIAEAPEKQDHPAAYGYAS